MQNFLAFRDSPIIPLRQRSKVRLNTTCQYLISLASCVIFVQCSDQIKMGSRLLIFWVKNIEPKHDLVASPLEKKRFSPNALRLLLIPSFQWEIEPAERDRGRSQLQKLKVSSAASAPNLLWVREDFYHFRNSASKTSSPVLLFLSSFPKGSYPALLFLCV